MKRRKWPMVVTFLVIVAIALAMALNKQAVYRATATLSIERQDVPPELVETTVTGYVEERIQKVTNRVLTNARLVEFAKEIGLYDPETFPMDERLIAEWMRTSIDISLQDVQATQPGGRKERIATVSFTVGFKAQTPEKAQEGAKALANLYLQYEKQARLDQVRAATEFLEHQANILREEISGLETKLAAFKQDNVRKLPEHADLNMRLLEQTDEKIERTEEQIRELKQRKTYLAGQLAGTSPYQTVRGADGTRVLSATEQLASLRSDYLAASARYASGHPDLARMRREIQLLEAEMGSDAGVSGILEQLAYNRGRLEQLETRYSADHPDVKRLRRETEQLEQRLAEASANNTDSPAAQAAQRPTNPAYIQLQTDLEAVNASLAADQSQLTELRTRRQQYERRLFETPEVEREYLRLSRDHENAVNKYREIRNKQLAAETAERLEEQERAQRFSLVAEPALPTSAEPPSRRMIVMLGLVIAMGGSVGVGTVAEYLDPSIRGVRGIIGTFGAPPLAAIPRVENEADAARRRRKKRAAVLVTALLLIAAAVFIYLSLFPGEPPVEGGQAATQATD